MTYSRPLESRFAAEGAVVACMASYPARYGSLLSAVASIAPQVDRLFVYANETTEGLPDLSGLGDIVVLDGREHAGNLSANGKVYPLRFLSDCLVLTVDDDFVYPPDYVARLRETILASEGRCCVTVHGSIFPPSVQWYYERTVVLVSRRALPATQLVTLAGSGTFAFHQATLHCAFEDFLPDVMVDLRFSLLAREQGLPIWCVVRPEGWLAPMANEGLWEAMRTGVTHHTTEARRHDWSFAHYRAIANRALAAAGDSGRAALRLDPELAHGLETGTPPLLWRPGRSTYAARADYLRVLAAS